MAWKIENDSIVLSENKNPIWIHDDGKEAEVNFGGALSSIRDLSQTNKQYKTQLAEYENKLKNFEGIEPEKARKAIDTIANIDTGKLIDAGKKDEAIQKAIETVKAEYTSKMKSLETALNEHSEKIKGKDATIFNLMVSSQFAQSEFLKSKTTMTPDIAALRFGQSFKIEDIDGQLKPVAYHNNEKIYSLKNPGKLADFDEALKTIWDSYEYKNNYLKDVPGGTGSGGGHGKTSGRDIILGKADALNPQAYRAAKEQAAKSGGQVIFQ